MYAAQLQTLNCVTLTLLQYTAPALLRQSIETTCTQCKTQSKWARIFAHHSHYDKILLKLKLFKNPACMRPKFPNFFLRKFLHSVTSSKASTLQLQTQP